MNRFRALLVAILLLALPAQGLAAYTPAMACTDAQTMHGDGHDQHHEQHAPADVAMDHHHQSDSGTADPAGGHSCCHHVVSAGAPALIAGIAEVPRILVSRVSSLATLYIPELPQRPPRA
ncbi:MAG: hypothetical protein KF771_13110 [Burkholderiales bacterium]|nr:hypothetical protein [Burkholderiales bacterium]